jgi:hypothetical protein
LYVVDRRRDSTTRIAAGLAIVGPDGASSSPTLLISADDNMLEKQMDAVVRRTIVAFLARGLIAAEGGSGVAAGRIGTIPGVVLLTLGAGGLVCNAQGQSRSRSNGGDEVAIRE